MLSFQTPLWEGAGTTKTVILALVTKLQPNLSQNGVWKESMIRTQHTRAAEVAAEGPLLRFLEKAEALAGNGMAVQFSAEGLRRRVERRMNYDKYLRELFENNIPPTLWEPHEPATAPSWPPAPRRKYSKQAHA